MNINRTYWKSGSGDPYNGGRFGADVTVIVDGVVVASSTCRPDDAVGITEEEYEQLVAAFRTEWEQRAIGGQAFVDQTVADSRALRESAAVKLAAGDALTVEEARAVTGVV